MTTITTIAAVMAALSIGLLLGLWVRAATIGKLREVVAGKDMTLRRQGRELGDFRAAEHRRQQQREAAAKKAGEAARVRAAAKRGDASAIPIDALKPARKRKTA